MAQRSNPLHNFSLPSLRWGNQRHLRCMKVNSNGEIVSSSDLSDRIDCSRSSGSDDSDEKKDLKFVNQRSLITQPQPQPQPQPHSSSGLKLKLKSSKVSIQEDEEFRERLLLHFRTETEKTKFSNQEDESGAGVKPWNLRTRRAACKDPNGESSKLDEQRRNQQHQHNVTLKKIENPSPKSLRLKGLAAMAANQGIERKERRKFSATLSRDEIKEDFLILTGNNPTKRPKKRAKTIQKQLDNLFPGLWLTEITTDTYKVPDEVIETKKK